MESGTASTKRVGTTLRGKWVLEKLIGVGGMASVYLGRHKIGRLEAIKILHADIAAAEDIRARFEQEAHAVNALRHPGAVEVRDIDITEDGAPFLVMELLEGELLTDRASREPPLPLGEVLRLAIETLDVLEAAHAGGIIHRDIKPDNLFVTSTGKIKVLDFGIARVRASGGRAFTTQAGMTLGTMAYMPPEQARGLEIDGRADLYAVGATVYRLLSGGVVHDATTEAELVMKAMSEPAKPLRSVAPAVPAEVCAVVDRALAFDRSNRYPDARTMKGDLEAVARGDAAPYAASAAPLPLTAPSSELFALRESFFGEAPGSAGLAPASSARSSANVARPSVSSQGQQLGSSRAGLQGTPTRIEGAANAPQSPRVVAGQGVTITPVGDGSVALSNVRAPAPPSRRSPPAATMLSVPSSVGGRASPLGEPHAVGATRTNTAGLVVVAGIALLVLLTIGCGLALVLCTRPSSIEEADRDLVDPASAASQGAAPAPTPAKTADSKGERGNDKKGGPGWKGADKKKGR